MKSHQAKFFIVFLFATQAVFCQNAELVLTNIPSPKELIAELEQKLIDAGDNPELRFRIQSEACDRLVKRGNYDLVDSLFTVTDQLFPYQTDSSMIMNYKSTKAFMFKLDLSFAKSLTEYLEILKYHERKNDLNQICLVKAQLSEFYRAQGDAILCNQFALEAKLLTEKHDIKPAIKAFVYSRAAAYHSEYTLRGDSVFYYATLALDTAIIASDEYVTALSQSELGFYHMNHHPEDTATSFGYYRSAIKNFIAEERYRDCLSVIQNLARNYLYRGNYNKAIDLLSAIIPGAIDNGWGVYLDPAYYIMAMSHNYLGNSSETERYMRLAMDILQDKLDIQHEIEVGKLTSTYEKDLVQNALNEAKEDARLNSKIIRFISVFIFFLVIATFIISRLFIKVKKTNKVLSSQREVIESKNEELQFAIEEKEVLYKELNHRVKNNLMILSSMIYLENETFDNEDPERDALSNSLRNRIQTMALVHEKLYGQEGSVRVVFDDYISELAQLIFSTLTPNGPLDIPLRISCKDLNLPIGEAIPLALIFNELITNTIKHGSPASLKKGIEISSEKINEGTSIIYADFGKGLDDDFDLERSKNMGMRIVKLMVRQLKGSIEFPKRSKGLAMKLNIPY